MWGRVTPKPPVQVSELPTWAEDGPKNYWPPKSNSLKYKPSTEINEKITLWMRGDSSRLAADAIVNAANAHLAAGGGICGVIHRAAGPELERACDKIGYTPTGKAAITPGFNLPAKHVIHAVGPIGERPAELESAYKSTLEYIDGDKVKSIGFCCISTGIYGYPIEPATHVALRTVREFLENEENRKKTDRLIFVIFEPRDVRVYSRLIHEYFPLEGVEYPEDIEEEETAPKKKFGRYNSSPIREPVQIKKEVEEKKEAEVKKGEEEEKKEKEPVEEKKEE